MEIFQNILMCMFILAFGFALFLLAVPIWSDSKEVCKYWEKQDNEMICIQETRLYCFSRNCND